uniref:Secreted protein n=1 Tax=Vitrella brassicaformis TaxID=1169539 RepID=A0A7S1K0Q1_9ALVE
MCACLLFLVRLSVRQPASLVQPAAQTKQPLRPVPSAQLPPVERVCVHARGKGPVNTNEERGKAREAFCVWVHVPSYVPCISFSLCVGYSASLSVCLSVCIGDWERGGEGDSAIEHTSMRVCIMCGWI